MKWVVGQEVFMVRECCIAKGRVVRVAPSQLLFRIFQPSVVVEGLQDRRLFHFNDRGMGHDDEGTYGWALRQVYHLDGFKRYRATGTYDPWVTPGLDVEVIAYSIEEVWQILRSEHCWPFDAIITEMQKQLK